MIYKVELTANTPRGPLLIESKRTFYIEGNHHTIDDMTRTMREKGWNWVAVPVATRSIESLVSAFERTIELDTEF